MGSSYQHQIQKKDRVHITYDVETNGASELKELPFIVGVMGDFSGDSDKELPPLRDPNRKFVQIDRNNFDKVMAGIAPKLKFKVESTMDGQKGQEFEVNLEFKSMDDFDPAKIVEQIPQLKKIMDTRNSLRDMLAKADSSAKLEAELEKLLQDQDRVRKIKDDLEKSGDQETK